MMKIALEILKFFAQGGIQRDLIFTAGALVRRSAEVVILTERAEGPAPAGCTLVTLPAHGISNHARARNFARQAAAYLKAHPVDAVLGFNRLPGLDLYFAGDDALAKRWINPVLNALLPRRRTFLALEKAVFSSGGAPKIFTLTARQERDYAQYYGTKPERFFRLAPGVDAAFQHVARTPEARAEARAQFGVTADKIMLVQAAASFHTKGVDRLLDMLEALPEDLRAKVTAIVAGGGKDVAHFQRKALRSNLSVTFIGRTDDMPGLLAGADLMVHAARAEATGGVLAEALVSGVPVLTTELCGYAEFVCETHGGVVLPEPFDLAQWRDALAELLRNPAKLTNFRANLTDTWREQRWYGRDEIIAEEVLKFAEAKKGGVYP